MPAISFLPFLQTVPLATRILTGTLIVASLGGFLLQGLADRSMTIPGLPGSKLPWLVMSPGESIWYPWVLLTSGWVELNIVEVGLSAADDGTLFRHS
jgi:hypothetical protein